MFDPVERKEKAISPVVRQPASNVPLLSIPDYKAQRHHVILRGTGLTPAWEVSFLSALQCAKSFGDAYLVLFPGALLLGRGGGKCLCKSIHSPTLLSEEKQLLQLKQVGRRVSAEPSESC